MICIETSKSEIKGASFEKHALHSVDVKRGKAGSALEHYTLGSAERARTNTEQDYENSFDDF